MRKPDPAFFAGLVEAARCDASELAYVGDRADNDVRPAALLYLLARHAVMLGWDDAARALAARLQSTGLTVVQRGRLVVVATPTEHEANALAERLRGEAPEAASITAEGSAAAAMDELDPLSAATRLRRRT